MFSAFRAALIAAASLLALPASADSARTILVLDGSGSMWGQIEGQAKITIAQSVVGDLLGEVPADMELGLTVYGHRRKGDCGDIESLVPVGANTTDAIRDAVNAIKPKGKTPLSAAVLAAAEELKYTEEKATVILVSDGRETCDVDPCALGNELEETGVDFTAHVVGFDVAEEKDKAQLQCLAENTGGTFVSASNATELKDALTKVAAPTAFDVTFRATDGEGGPTITDGLIWTVTQGETALLDHDPTAEPVLPLEEGTYTAEVLRPDDEATASVRFGVAPETGQVVVLVLETPLPEATISGPEKVEIASTIPVEWTGPGAKGDVIAITRPDAESGDYGNYSYITEGSPTDLLMPPEPGEYELRYIFGDGVITLATQAITVEPVPATLDAPETAEIASTIKVDWTGPDRKNDYVGIYPAGDDEARYIHYTYTQAGSPLKLLMPGEPGEYELRYVLSQGAITLATRPITVEPVKTSVTAPDSADVGSTVKVEWVGPDAANDYVAIFPAGDDEARYTAYSYTKDGSPLKLLMPTKPGEYEIRYVLSQGTVALASTPISIKEAEVSVVAPETAELGSTIKVEWVGPDAKNDYIAIFPSGDDEARSTAYTYTKDGSPLKLLMPSEPGDYEIRYVLSQGNTPLASTPISIKETEVSVSAPETAELGSTIKVEWVGPDAKNDYIAVYPAGDDEARSTAYTYTRDGTPLKLLMPSEPGEYEIRYVLNQGKTVLATTPISIKEAEVKVAAPETAELGSTIKVEWIGPDAQNDYIAVYPAGDDEARSTAYTYTRNGTPLKLLMPSEPGEYEIRYILNQGKTVLATTPISIKEAEVSVSAPETAELGSTIKVEWIGPDAQNDYIGIFPAGDDESRSTAYTRTNKGSPLKLLMPSEPGEYEIRYVLNQGKTVLASTPISITEGEVSVTAPETAEVGSTIKVEWVGPDASSDYVGIFPVGDDEARATSYTRTNKGSPLKLLMPSEAGEYEIRYVLNQGKTVLASTPISIAEGEVSVTAPETAEVGSTIKVEWVGPDASSDYIGIFPVGDDEARATSYTRTNKGSPLKLFMPSEPGEYEIRYVLNQGKTVLATTPITISEAEVTLEATETTKPGYTINVEWTGPDANGDFIGIYAVGGVKAISSVRTSRGSPAKLDAPDTAGTFEIRYVLNQSKRVLATRKIEVEE